MSCRQMYVLLKSVCLTGGVPSCCARFFRLIEAAVDQMATLPGIGRRTALRLVLYMLARDEERVRDLPRPWWQ